MIQRILTGSLKTFRQRTAGVDPLSNTWHLRMHRGVQRAVDCRSFDNQSANYLLVITGTLLVLLSSTRLGPLLRPRTGRQKNGSHKCSPVDDQFVNIALILRDGANRLLAFTTKSLDQTINRPMMPWILILYAPITTLCTSPRVKHSQPDFESLFRLSQLRHLFPW